MKEEVLKYTKPVLDFITDTAVPVIIEYSQKSWAYYKRLPADYLQLIIGTIFCFFGGIFPALFAAIEAAKHGGVQNVVEALGDLSEEALKIIEASKKDDDLDEDGDGKKDVDQLSAKELLSRKVHLVITKMNPEKVDRALSSIYKVWLSVLAVLTLQFAQTIALGMSISDFLKKPVNHYVAPVVRESIPKEYGRWVPVILGWITKGIAISIAWFINAILTAITSALTGALMMSRALILIAKRKGITLDGLIPTDDKDTYIDEVVSYFFAFVGIYFQFSNGFGIPFPMNLFLWPIQLVEYFIRWSITD